MAIAPLAAQTESVPDPNAPAADTTPPRTPAVPAMPATLTPPQTSAATVISDSTSPSDNGVLSPGAGPTPVTGPGATPVSDLGSQISAASMNQKLPFRVTATVGEVYDDNIFAQSHKQSDFITRLAVQGEYHAGDLLVPDGNYFDMVYTPSLHVYSRHSHESGVDQNVDALYGHRWTKLTLTLEQSYTKTQETDATVGGLVTADVYTTTAKADYAYSQKLDLVVTGQQVFSNYNEPGYTDSQEWSGNFYALYHIDPKLSVGFGPNFGYLNFDEAPSESYEQYLARVIYVPSDKLNFVGVAGFEDRQYDVAGQSDTLEPIFELDAVYLPEPSTRIALNVGRHFQPSYSVEHQDYIGTNVYLTITQRFLNAYYLGLAAGFENDDYKNIGGGPPVERRNDNFYFIQPNLTWEATGWLKVAAFDRYEEDSSNLEVFSYDINQVGLSVSATY